MIVTREYMVGGHLFSVSSDEEYFRLMGNYSPFTISKHSSTQKKTFALSIETGNLLNYAENMRQDDAGQIIICGKTPEDLPIFEFQWRGESGGCLVCSKNYQEGRLITTGQYKKATIDNALMIIYALATADKKTVLFHAAVVSHCGKGYMFLGRSGTGKSTHARLWTENINEVELVNDDNPVVRIDDEGQTLVYGTPWSGKTPCYRNVSHPLGGIVTLRQAPHNKIVRLNGIRAFATLATSISGIRWDKRVADGLYASESELTKNVPIWEMECLPNREAAELCKSVVTHI